MTFILFLLIGGITLIYKIKTKIFTLILNQIIINYDIPIDFFAITEYLKYLAASLERFFNL
jgi:hypothetical protein